MQKLLPQPEHSSQYATDAFDKQVSCSFIDKRIPVFAESCMEHWRVGDPWRDRIDSFHQDESSVLTV